MRIRGRRVRPWVEHAIIIIGFLGFFLLAGLAGAIERGHFDEHIPTWTNMD